MVLYYREYRPTCVERNYGTLVPKHLKAKCFVPYNTPPDDDNLQANTYHPAPNVLMNLAMTKDPQKLCKPCCERLDRERQSHIKTVNCCCSRFEQSDCCKPCPERPNTSSGSDSPTESKKGSRMSLKSKSAATSVSNLSLTNRKRKKKSRSHHQYMMTYPSMMHYPYGPAFYGPAMFGPGGPYAMPVMGPTRRLSRRPSEISRTESNTNLRAPTFPNSKVLALVNYDKNHPFCGPYVTTPSGKKIFSQRRENEMGTSYIWPQGILNKLMPRQEGRNDVSCYANIVEYDNNIIIEDETTSSDQLLSDDSSFLQSKLVQPEISPTPGKSINDKTTNDEWDVVDRRPVFKNTGPRSGNLELSRTDSYEINCHFLQDYAISSNDELSRYTRSSSEWIDNESGDIIENQSIGVQYSEVVADEDTSSFKVDRKISTSSLVKSRAVYGTSMFDSNSKSIQVGCNTTNEAGTSPNPLPLKINSIVQADLREVAMMNLAHSTPFEVNKDKFLEYNSSVSTHHSVSQRLRYLSRPDGPTNSTSQESHSHTKIVSLSSSRSGFPARNEHKCFPPKKLYENLDLRYVESHQNLRITSQQSRNENLDREKSIFSKPQSKVPDNIYIRDKSPHHRERKLSRPLKSTSEEALFRTNFERPLRRKCECSARHPKPPRCSATALECTDPSSLKSSRPKKSSNSKKGKRQVVEATEIDERQANQTQAPTCSTCKRKDLHERSRTPEVQKSSHIKSKIVKNKTFFLDYQTKHGTREDINKKSSCQEGDYGQSQHTSEEHARFPPGPNLVQNLDQIVRTSPTKYQMPLHVSHEEFCRIWREPDCGRSQAIYKHRMWKSTHKDNHKIGTKGKGKQLCPVSHRSECHTDSFMSNNVALQDRTQTAVVTDRYICQKKVDQSVPESLKSRKDPTTVNFVLISDSVVESAVQLTEDPSQPSRLTTSQNRSTTSNWRRSEECSRSQSVLPASPYAVALCPVCDQSEHAIPSEMFRPSEMTKRKSKKKRRWYFEGIRFAAKK